MYNFGCLLSKFCAKKELDFSSSNKFSFTFII